MITPCSPLIHILTCVSSKSLMQFLAHSVVCLNMEIMEVAEFPGGRVLQRKKRQSINCTDSKEAEAGARRDNNE